jgi:hypothetical protein
MRISAIILAFEVKFDGQKIDHNRNDICMNGDSMSGKFASNLTSRENSMKPRSRSFLNAHLYKTTPWY